MRVRRRPGVLHQSIRGGCLVACVGATRCRAGPSLPPSRPPAQWKNSPSSCEAREEGGGSRDRPGPTGHTYQHDMTAPLPLPSPPSPCDTASRFACQGRVCVATQPFKAGDVLFEDKAFVHASELPDRYHMSAGYGLVFEA